jgi:hypothetical protein
MERYRRGRLWIAAATLLLLINVLAPATVAAASDSDHDGLPNWWERASSHTNPFRADTNRNGIRDGAEDPDRDGLTNRQEYLAGMNPLRADSNRNGIRDGQEDTDGDGLRTAFEFRAGTSPRRADSNYNGTRDGAEDPDHDGLSNAREQRLGTNPRVADTDGDGWTDGAEVRAGTDPRNRASHPMAATPIPTAMPSPAPLPAASGRLWGLIGNDGSHQAAERGAGVNTKVFELAWNGYEPGGGAFSASYIALKQAELAGLRAAGFAVILSLGIHHPPGWLHDYPASWSVDQYGDPYNDTREGSGNADLIWNTTLRGLAAGYVARVFADFGTDFAAVRAGGGRFGELGYPVATWNGHANTYWAFGPAAAASDPVPGWKPGDPSPNGEAGRFATWYMDQLVDFENWQVAIIRRSFAGRIMMLYPGWGIRPTQLATAVGLNLNGTSSAELNGEVPRGYDYARQVGALTDPRVVVTSTWLDAPTTNDGGTDQRYWSPIHYLASLADRAGREKFGENTGTGSAAQMTLSAQQASRYGLLGLVWYREDQLLSGAYASLADFQRTIAAYGP